MTKTERPARYSAADRRLAAALVAVGGLLERLQETLPSSEAAACRKACAVIREIGKEAGDAPVA